MQAKACLFDYWRNYKPLAPNQRIEVRNSGSSTIDILKIIQGARDEETLHSPTEGVLDKVPVQRGWRLKAIKVNDPLVGTVDLNYHADQFIYNPRSGYVGLDCFDYIVTNGTQQSDSGTITLDVIQWYTYQLLIYRRNAQKTYHRFTANPFMKTAPGQTPLKSIKYVEFAWYYNQYIAETGSDGVVRIYKRRTLVQATQSNYTLYDSGQAYAPVILNAAKEITMYSYFDDSLGEGFDGDLNIPFVPRRTQGDIELDITLYTEERTVYVPIYGKNITQVDLTKPITLNYRVSDIYGQKWWDSGNILV